MRGQIKATLSIYLCLLLLTVPCVSKQDNLPNTTIRDIRIQKITEYISNKYKVDSNFTETVVNHSFKVGNHKYFPTPIDILAIIAIESSFNKYAVSKSNAKGLMQVLYKPTNFEVETNIEDGTKLLKDYGGKLSLEGTIQAYNVGITNYKKGMRNIEYLNKFKTIKQQLESI